MSLNTMFPLGELFHTKSSDNYLPREAFEQAHRMVCEEEGQGLFAELLSGRIGSWDSSSNPWTLWTAPKYVYKDVEFSGALTVRLNKLYRKMHGKSINTELLSRIGALLGQFKKEVDLLWTIDRIFDWEPGDFAERDGKSCWWNSNNYCRVGLAAHPDSRVVLFFRDEAQYNESKGKKGIGRSWLMEQPDKGRALIFNAYGVSLSQTAATLAAQFNMNSAKVRIHSDNAYLNSGNLNNTAREGGETGLGYVIAPEVSEYSSSSTLHMYDFSSSYTPCSGCQKEYRPSHLHLKGYKVLCNDCLEKLYPKCITCGEYVENGNMRSIRYMGRQRHVCNRCYDRHNLGSKYHQCTIHGNTYDGCLTVWHTNRRYCLECQRDDKVAQCRTCRKYTDDYIDFRLGQNIFTLCIPCSRKVAYDIRNSPRQGYRNKAEE